MREPILFSISNLAIMMLRYYRCSRSGSAKAMDIQAKALASFISKSISSIEGIQHDFLCIQSVLFRFKDHHVDTSNHNDGRN